MDSKKQKITTNIAMIEACGLSPKQIFYYNTHRYMLLVEKETDHEDTHIIVRFGLAQRSRFILNDSIFTYIDDAFIGMNAVHVIIYSKYNVSDGANAFVLIFKLIDYLPLIYHTSEQIFYQIHQDYGYANHELNPHIIYHQDDDGNMEEEII